MIARGVALSALGALLLLSQLVARSPWQAGIALGLVALVAGAVALADSPRRHHARRIERHRSGRRGYIGGPR